MGVTERQMKKRNEEKHRKIFSKCIEKKIFSKKINIAEKPSLLIKKNLTSQNTINCPGCGDVYEDPITKDCIRCGKCSEW
jgi:hypothetical protein